MGFTCSVRSQGRELDIYVQAGAQARIGDLARQLAELAAAEAGCGLGRGDGTPFAADGLVSDSGIRAGDVLVLLPPSPAAPHAGPGPDYRGALHLHVTAGPYTGHEILVPADGSVVELGAVSLGGAAAGGLGSGEPQSGGDPFVEPVHAQLRASGAELAVYDLGSRHRTYLDGAPLAARQWTPLVPGSVLGLGPRTTLEIHAGKDAPRRVAAVADGPRAEYSGRSVFHRPPPQGHPLPRRLPERPGEQQPDAGSGVLATTLLMFATSTIGMLAMAAVEHSATMLLELPVLGASTLVSTGARQWYVRRHGHAKEHRAEREARWREFNEAVGARLEEERRRLAADYPEPRELYRRALTVSSRLWERHPADPDFLALRVGIGAMERGLVVDQTIAEASYLSADESTSLQDIPVTVSLPRDGALGIVGPPQSTRAAAVWLVAQAAVQSGPADLAIAVLVDPDDGEACRAWAWARWLPHTAADDGDVRVTRLGDKAQLDKIIRQLTARPPRPPRAPRTC
ncbi:hypothetical protein KDL01_19380 [Actinospica durhamensis]|uniref:FHA domain-containing protein n=1 Tax=Actinospica durhamensis TaxID=1508375 RepID=A0A941EQV3_9ACTN|nr:FHA domain-containing protein [Actinospica durhamensis]MBR7835446.1 hypothetical protein [Actinospica durhamensis]